MDDAGRAANVPFLHAELKQLCRQFGSACADKLVFPDGEFASVAEPRTIKPLAVLRNLALSAERAGYAERRHALRSSPALFRRKGDIRRAGRILNKERRQPCDALAETLFPVASPCDFCQCAFPSPRRFRRGDFLRHSFNQVNALFRRRQVLSPAGYVADADEPLDDCGAGRRRAEGAILHLLAQLLVLNLPPRMLHVEQNARVVVFLGRLGLILRHLRVAADPFVARMEIRQRLLVLFFLSDAPCAARLLPRINGFPALLRHGLPRAQEVILSACCDHSERVVFVIRIEHGCQPLGDQLIEPSLVRRQREIRRLLSGRNNGVVVGQLRIVKDALAHPHAVFQRLFAQRLQSAIIRGERALHLAQHIMREIAAVRSGIGQQLMLFIELLCGFQRLFCGKAELRVGFPLKRRQVIEQRRRKALMLPRRLQYGGLLPANPRGNRLRIFLRCDFLFAFSVDVYALVIAEIRVHQIIDLRNKRINLPAPPDQHAQRRRLHAPDGQQYAVTNRIGARRIHANQPIRIRATPCAGIQRIVIRRRAQAVKARANRFIRHGGNPKPSDGLSAPRLLIDVAEDEFSLPTGVRRADDVARFLVVHQLFYGEKLASRLFDDLGFHPCRQDWQIFLFPAGVSLIQLLRFLERDQVSQCPCDHIILANQTVFALLSRAQHTGDIPRNGRFFSQNKRVHGFTSWFTAPRRPAEGWQSACTVPATRA